MRKKQIKIDTNNIAVALLIGILGSAIWECLIRPFSNKFFIFISDLKSQYLNSSSNALYKTISCGFNERFSLVSSIMSFFLLVSLQLLISWVALVLLSRDSFFILEIRNDSPPLPRKKSYKMNAFFAILVLIELVLLIGSCLYYQGRAQFINTSITKCLNNIEIVSPYISDFEYKQLKSTFYQVSCKEDYDNLIAKLDKIAFKNDLVLK